MMRGVFFACVTVLASLGFVLPVKADGVDAGGEGLQGTTSERYYLTVPAVDSVIFHGQLEAGSVDLQSNAMMYPAYDAVSFLGAVAVHALMASSIDKKKKNDALQQADQILAPYQPIISTLSPQGVLERSLVLLSEMEGNEFILSISEDSQSPNGWQVAVEPVFILSRSEDAITIHAKVNIFESRFARELEEIDIAYSKMMHLRSSPVQSRDEWLLSEGMGFKDAVHRLLAEAVQLALSDFTNELPSAAKSKSTIRYADNGRKKIERGRLISKSCSHVLFESLRRGLKSMPLTSGSINQSCLPLEKGNKGVDDKIKGPDTFSMGINGNSMGSDSIDSLGKTET